MLDVFDHPVIARCRLHKLRNVQDKLPMKLRSVVGKRMRAADRAESALAAQAQLEILAWRRTSAAPSGRFASV